MKEILDERQRQLNLKCDNFTQTIRSCDLKSYSCKASQTKIIQDISKYRQTFTQTENRMSKSILTQTDEVSNNQTRPVLTNMNSSAYGSNNMLFINEFDKVERSYSKDSMSNFKNKNLVYAENNFGVNKMFESNLRKYLNDSGKEKKSKNIGVEIFL